MGKPEHFDPPPPYTATDFDRVNHAPSAPQYVPGVVQQQGPPIAAQPVQQPGLIGK